MISMNLYVKSISKSIKGEKVLDDISYTFESGKIYGIYGKNGSVYHYVIYLFIRYNSFYIGKLFQIFIS